MPRADPEKGERGEVPRGEGEVVMANESVESLRETAAALRREGKEAAAKIIDRKIADKLAKAPPAPRATRGELRRSKRGR